MSTHPAYIEILASAIERISALFLLNQLYKLRYLKLHVTV